jgi:hypothetical protein
MLASTTLHITQPLDVACCGAWKKAYSDLVLDLAKRGIFHVDEADFLAMYQDARRKALTQDNIQSGFRATGLVPYNPRRVLDNLPVSTPSPLPTSHGQTPPRA